MYGRKVKLRKTRRFGEAIHKFSQIIRRGILDSEEKEYLPSKEKGYVKSYLNFREIPFLIKGPENIKYISHLLSELSIGET